MDLATTVTIGVFGLFHPHSLDIEPYGSSRLEVRCEKGQPRVVEGRQRARLTSNCAVSGPADFVLIVPGKIRRHYQGTLETRVLPSGELLAIVRMSIEIAVASTVAAESPPGASKAMLEAQAIVTRSYFSAPVQGRHHGFEFCDTTHCQFIKDPPLPESAASRATLATSGQVLVYHDRIIAAFYAAKCDGLLAPLAASRVGDGDYPYFAVSCDYCLRNPSKAPLKSNARPHHHGMCQLGADDLAKQGWTATRILAHYYPGTALR